MLPLEDGVPLVLGDGEPAVLVPPPLGGGGGVVVGVVGAVVGVVGVVGGGVEVCDEVGGGGGGVLPPVSLRGGGGGGGGWVTSVVVVLPSGLTDTTVVGVLDDLGAVEEEEDDVGSPSVVGLVEDGVPGTVCRPAWDVPWPPVPPAVLAGSGPASSATAANAVATTSPATPSTTYPVRFGLLLFGGAVSILVMRELDSGPSGRGIQAPRGFGKARCEAGESITACPGGGTRKGGLGGDIITVGTAFAQVVGLCDHGAQSECPERMKRVSEEQTNIRLTAWVRGRVQGVGFRWWTRSRALELGLVGSARNMPDGRVEVIAEGDRNHCARLLAALRSGESPGSVESVVERWSDPKGALSGFVER